MKKTVWIDFDPEKLDYSYLTDRFQAAGYDVIAEVVDFHNEDAIIEYGLRSDAVVCQWEVWNEHTLSAVKDKVKFLMKFGIGTNNIDIPYATKMGIPVANIAGANASAVAEVALFHIMNCGRRFTYSAEGVRNGKWPCMYLGTELDGKTVGLYGYGNIAKQLIRMLSGFNVEILVYNRHVPTVIPDNVQFVDSLDALFKRSDFVSLHGPHTPETERSINSCYFNLMKPNACLINTCRGAVVNEEDLIAALKEGKIRGAGLDVLTSEPPEFSNELLHMENVTVTTHMGANARESDERAMVTIADSIIDFFNGKQPKNVLNKEVF